VNPRVCQRPSLLTPIHVTTNCPATALHYLKKKEKKKRENLLIVLWAQALCKGPWGGVERERDTRLEELTIKNKNYIEREMR